MNYRIYSPSDRDRCLEIFKSNVPKYFAEEETDEFIEWLKKGDLSNYYVVLNEDDIIGCGGIYVDHEKKKAGFTWGMIKRNLHKKGFGTSFSVFRIEQIKELCNYDIFLVTSQFTFEFYRKLGFQVLSIEKDGFLKGQDKYDMKLTRND